MVEASQQASRPVGQSPSITGVYLLVLVGAILLYGLTAQRGVGWQDSGEYQWRVLTGQYADQTGLARAHPLYIALGRLLMLIPIGEIATKLNLFSGLAMAVALANLAGLVVLLTGRRWIGAAAAGMLAVCHTAWWLSTVAEVYTLSAAGLTAELWLLAAMIRRLDLPKLGGLALVNGLGVCVHNFALLPLPVYVAVAIVLVVRRRLPAWSLAVAGAMWIVGASLYIGFIVGMALDTGDVLGAVRSALVGEYGREVFHAAPRGRHLAVNLGLACLNFLSLLLPLAAVGWARFRQRLGGPTAAAMGAITVIELLFVVRYPVPDQFTFLLPTLTMIALAAGVGLGVLLDAGGKWKRAAVAAAVVSILLPPAAYLGVLQIARTTGVGADRARRLAFRDEQRYWLLPWKHDEHSAEQFARAALREAAPDGVIVPDETSDHPLALTQWLEGRWPGVTVLLPPRAPDERTAAGRPVFVVSQVPGYCPEELLHAETFPRAEGEVLYRLRWEP